MKGYLHGLHGLRGRPPVGVARAAGHDFRRWAVANRVGWIALVWVAGISTIGLAGNPSVTSTAARAAYFLLAVYALRMLAHDSGQPSLGHAAFMALGAYSAAGLRLRFGLDGLLATVAATLLGGTVGWVMGWGASRLRPAVLALLTWAFGWLVFVALGAFPAVTGGVAGISLRAPLRVRWDVLGVDLAVNDFGHLVLGSALLALFLLLYRSAQDSAIGRGWAALRESGTLATSLGYEVPSARRWTFAVSAAVAALAGSLGAQLIQVVDPTLYTPLQSLNLFVAVLIGSPLGFFGPAIGALVVSGVPQAVDYAGQVTGLPLGSGRQLAAAAVTVLALALSMGVAGRRTPRAPRKPLTAAPTPPGAVRSVVFSTRRQAGAAAPLLEATGITVDFDGLRALDSASISLARGSISGLVGPNGSGKSTMLRCLAGTIVPGAGSVALDGRRMDGLGEAARVEQGIARTFQRTALMPHLRVAEHIEVGLRRRYRHAATLQSILKSPAYRTEAAAARESATRVLSTFGLQGLEEAYPETLSNGRQRLLQVATAAATGPRVLLLDEPSAGMSPDEVDLLRSALASLRGEGMSILLIEHNMRFLADVASHVTVLDGGHVLAAGTPAQVTRNADVRRAYLGASGGPRPRRRSPAITRPR